MDQSHDWKPGARVTGAPQELIPAPMLTGAPHVSWGQADQHPAATPAPDGGAHRYWSAFRRRGLWALLIGLAFGGLAGSAAWLLQPEKYTTTAVLRVLPSDQMMLFQTADAERRSTQSFKDYKRTQRLLIRSGKVIEKAIRDYPELTNIPALTDVTDPTAWLEKNISVAYPDDGELMTVSLSAAYRQGLHELLNGVVDAYFEQIVTAERSNQQDRLGKLVQTRVELEKRLKLKREQLNAVDRSGGTSAKLSREQQNAVDRYAALSKELLNVQLELMQFDLTSNQSAGDPQVKSVLFQEELKQLYLHDSELQEIRTQKEQFQRYMAETKARLTPSASAEKSTMLELRLKAFDRKLKAREKQLQDQYVEFKQRAATVQKATEQSQFDQLQATERRLTQLLDAMEIEAPLSMPSAAAEMFRLDLTVMQDIVSKIASEIERTEIELKAVILGDNQSTNATPSSRVSLWAKAREAQKPDPMDRIRTTAGAGLAGLLLPVLLLIWLDARKDRIYTKDSIDGLGLSTIGAIPRIPPRIMRDLSNRSAKAAYWRSRLSESVDSIGAAIIKAIQTKNLRALMVSSSTAGEGKTTLAANLAASLAGAGLRTVLVDFDLRRPALHRLLGLPLQPGVCDVLRTPDTLAGAIQMTMIPNLHFLPAGRSGKSGLGRLTGASLQKLIGTLRDQYDFVLVDGSPILPVVDTRLIAQKVDAVILSVLSDHSRVGLVRAACQQLEHFDIPVLGVVMVGSKRDAYPQTYQDYYSSQEFAEAV